MGANCTVVAESVKAPPLLLCAIQPNQSLKSVKRLAAAKLLLESALGDLANESIQTLDLMGQGLGDEGVGLVTEALAGNRSLTSLDLRWNSIGPEGAAKLARVLAACGPLERLDLFCNSIGDEGTKRIAAALPKNNRLKSIDVGYNSVGDLGAAALAGVLESSCSLHEVGLEQNYIGDRGAIALAGALAKNLDCPMTRLRLKQNPLEEEGVLAIADAVMMNPALSSDAIDILDMPETSDQYSQHLTDCFPSERESLASLSYSARTLPEDGPHITLTAEFLEHVEGQTAILH